MSFGFGADLRFRLGGPCEWIRPRAPSTLPVVIKTTASATTITATTITAATIAAATWGLVALLFDQLGQLSVFKHLAQCAHGETEHGHR